jgi:hypothetical protein
LANKKFFLEMEDSMRRLEILHPLIESMRGEAG